MRHGSRPPANSDPRKDEEKKAYRQAGEPWDERPLLVSTSFWEDMGEFERFMAAVRDSHPLPRGSNMPTAVLLAKVHEVAERAEGKALMPPSNVVSFIRDPGEDG